MMADSESEKQISYSPLTVTIAATTKWVKKVRTPLFFPLTLLNKPIFKIILLQETE